MQSNVVNPRAKKSSPLRLSGGLITSWDDCRIAPPTQPEHEAAEARLQGLRRIEFTHDPDSPGAKDVGDLQDTDRTSAEPEPAETSSKGVLEIALAHGYPSGGELLPQPLYRPHQSDRRIHHATQVQLEAPILFFTRDLTVLGIPLKDALSSRFVHLDGREDPMFTDHGPSVSIRLLWPGYASWSRLIPTRDFRSPPQPVTRAKLARNVAKTIKRFIDEMTGRRMEDEDGPEAKWRVGDRHITVEDLVLVGLQHVSMGSWQACVRVLRRQ